jgi:hypothetical protein
MKQIKKEVSKMRRITLSIIAIAILTLVGGMAFADDTFTVNGSEQEGAQGTALVNKYAAFAVVECSGTAGLSGGNCNDHGMAAISAWIDGTFMAAGGEFVPDYNNNVNSGFTPQMQDMAFGVGKGLPSAWLSQAVANTYIVPWGTAGTSWTDWVDQIAIGYVASSDFAQNFRVQFANGNDWNRETGEIVRSGACITDGRTCNSLIDQRLEQGDADQSQDGESKQAFQQAFGATAAPSRSSNPTVSYLGGDNGTGSGGNNEVGLAQNVEQSGEGFFYSCMNCSLNNEHSFTPPEKAVHQTWPTRPKITQIRHADSTLQTTWTP